MADVTSGLLSENTAARYQLTAQRFPVPVGKLSANDGDDGLKTEVRLNSTDQTENGRPHSGDISTTTTGYSSGYFIGNEGVPIQLTQCWFPGLAICNAKI